MTLTLLKRRAAVKLRRAARLLDPAFDQAEADRHRSADATRAELRTAWASLDRLRAENTSLRTGRDLAERALRDAADQLRDTRTMAA